MNVSVDSISTLRSIPAFVEYARREMRQAADFWNRERVHGTGVMRGFAIAVCEIGGDD